MNTNDDLPNRGSVFLNASSCANPVHSRHWLELFVESSTSTPLAAMRGLALMCQRQGLESVTVSLPQGFRWGPHPREGIPAPRSDCAILEIACLAAGPHFRIRGQSREGNDLCQTAFRPVEQFINDVTAGHRLFADTDPGLVALTESISHPSNHYGPEPGRFECRMCGSSNVIADANASWNVTEHRWQMADDVGCHFFCAECEETCKVDWVTGVQRVESIRLSA